MKIRYLAFRSPADLAVIPADAEVIGIEVPPTAPMAARERCTLGIIDPQHTDGLQLSASLACLNGTHPAIKALLAAVKAGRAEIWLITPRFDLDAGVAMAILTREMRELVAHMETGVRMGGWSRATQQRITAVDRADNFLAGTLADWPGPQDLPTVAKPWNVTGGVGEVEELAGPNWLTGWTLPGVGLTLETVVGALRSWLEEGPTSEGRPIETIEEAEALARDANTRGDARDLLWAADKAAKRSRLDLAVALENGTLKPEPIHDGRAVFMDLTKVRLPSTATAGIGYCVAPVSTVRLFDARAGQNRFSVACFNPKYLDFDRFVAEINALEKGGGTWGGNRASGMIGSPQGKDTPTTITLEEFLAVVGRCLR